MISLDFAIGDRQGTRGSAARSLEAIFNEVAFTAAPTGQQGDLGRNVLRGFDAAQADIAVQRIFASPSK